MLEGLRLLGQAVRDFACLSAHSEPLTSRASSTCLLPARRLFFISLRLSFWVRSLMFIMATETEGSLVLNVPQLLDLKVSGPSLSHSL